MAKGTRWVVTIAEDHYIQDVAHELAALGMSRQTISAKVGSITGVADPKAVARMRRVEGVLEITPEVSQKMTPPDKNHAW